MTDRWIFQDIVDFEARIYDEAKTTGQKITGGPLDNFYKNVREQIDPELFTKYLIYKCDVYVDCNCIIYEVQRAFPHIKPSVIYSWIENNKGEEQYLI